MTNYGAFLAAHPPTHEVADPRGYLMVCAHGVERWRSDCGCRFRPDSQQRWRGPLRDTLDWLRDQIDPFYEARAGASSKTCGRRATTTCAIVLDRDPHGWRRSWPAPGGPARRRRPPSTRRLLELQRNRMLMYTSCGWFFDESRGWSRYRSCSMPRSCMQYLRDLGGPDLEPELVRRLAAAPSNAADFAHGGEVYRRLVTPLTTDLRRVAAHYAITGLFTEYPDQAAIYAYRVERLDETRQTGSGTVLRVAHVRVESTIAGEARDVMYAVLHFGGHDFSCALRAWEGRAAYDG